MIRPSVKDGVIDMDGTTTLSQRVRVEKEKRAKAAESQADLHIITCRRITFAYILEFESSESSHRLTVSHPFTFRIFPPQFANCRHHPKKNT